MVSPTVLLAQLAVKPLALCPLRGAAALRALAAMRDDELDEDPEQREERRGVVSLRGVLVRRGTGTAWIDDLFGIAAYDTITARLEAAARDSDEVVLEVDSPGGDVQGLLDAADAVRALRGKRKVVAVANENALSAAYVIAAAADRVVLPRTGAVGSVGVIAMHTDLSGMLAQAGVRVELVTAGDRKADGSPYAPLSARAREEIQAEVDRAYGLLAAHVAESRGMTERAVRATEAGVYHGELAVKAGLADEVGTLAGVLGGRGNETKASARRSPFGARAPWHRRTA